MKSAARSCVWWPRIDDAIETFVRSCAACQQQRAMPAKVDLHQWSWPRKPWSRVHLDYAGPVDGGKYLLVAVDAMTKWVEVEITSSQTSSMTADRFRALCTRFGLPDTVVFPERTTDQPSQERTSRGSSRGTASDTSRRHRIIRRVTVLRRGTCGK